MTHTVSRVTQKSERGQVKEFIDAHHSYIKFADRPSRKLYWLLWEREILVGVFGLGSAFSRPKPVAEYMEKHNIVFNEVGNNIVYCLFGCVDRNSGTRFLSLCRRDAAQWWAEKYGNKLKALQTFILPPRTGAVYKADNWEQLGMTSSGASQVTRTIKPSEAHLFPKAIKKVFKSGEVRFFIRSYQVSEAKLIFMKLLTCS